MELGVRLEYAMYFLLSVFTLCTMSFVHSVLSESGHDSNRLYFHCLGARLVGQYLLLFHAGLVGSDLK